MKNSINQQTTAQAPSSKGNNPVRALKAKSVLSLLTLVSFVAPALVRADCIPTAPAGYLVPFSMVAQQTYAASGGNGDTGYASGNFVYTAHNKFFEGTTVQTSSELLLSQDTLSLNGCVGFFCEKQPFYLNAAEALSVSISDGHSILMNVPSVVNVTLSSPTLGKVSGIATCDPTSGELYFSTPTGMNVITFGDPFRIQ